MSNLKDPERKLFSQSPLSSDYNASSEDSAEDSDGGKEETAMGNRERELRSEDMTGSEGPPQRDIERQETAAKLEDSVSHEDKVCQIEMLHPNFTQQSLKFFNKNESGSGSDGQDDECCITPQPEAGPHDKLRIEFLALKRDLAKEKADKVKLQEENDMLQVENNKLQGEKKRIQDKLKNSRLPPRISRRIRNSRKVEMKEFANPVNKICQKK